MIEKIRTFLWFLGKPELYPQMFYQLKQSFVPHKKEMTRQHATEICIAKSENHEAIFDKLGIKPIVDFEKAYDIDIKKAMDIESRIPLKMGGAGDSQLLFNIIRNEKPKVVVETGVAYGWSSLAILLAMEENDIGELLSTDMPYAKMNNENYVGSVVPSRLSKYWELIRLPDRQALRKIAKKHKQVDIVHYDSDKSYRGRKWAYPFLWKLLKNGGILISDDINDNIGFFDFADSLKKEPLVVEFEEKYIGILRK